MASQDIILLVAGVLAPIIFAFYVFLDRRHIYATWAKIVCVIASIAAIGWGFLDWILLHGFYLTHQAYYQLVGHRQLLAGLWIGLLLSVLIAHSHQKPKPPGETGEKGAERPAPRPRPTPPR